MKYKKQFYALVDKNNKNKIYQVNESYFVLLINKFLKKNLKNAKIIKWE